MLCVPTARAGDDWNQADTVRQVIASGFIVLDWSQTLYISEHHQYGENNIFLRTLSNSSHPRRGDINIYESATLVSNYMIAHWLSSKWRRYFQYATISIEAAAVGNNARIGIGFSF